MELFQAHNQWSTRPDDEQFQTIRELYDATEAYALTAVERDNVRIDSLRADVIDGSVQIVGKGKVPARLTHYAFGQLARRVGAPADYLRELPPTLAVQNLNHGLAKRVADDADAEANLLFHNNGSVLLRAMTGTKYERIWNFEIAAQLLELESTGWVVAVPDFNQRDNRKPLYASDHDMFAFIMRPDRVLREGSRNPLGLKRGLIVSNSEVGAGALWLMYFYYREMCGNHIIWGAEDVIKASIRHVGSTARDKFNSWQIEIAKYMDASATDEEQKIAAVQTKRLATSKDELFDLLFGKRALGLSRKVLVAAYDAVNPDEDGDPLTAWGIVQGLTRYSQATPYADERMKIDRAAGRILEAF